MKYLLAFSLLLSICSCRKHSPDPVAAGGAEMKIEIRHGWSDTNDFALNTLLVNPLNGDSLNFSTFKYYLSNVRLQRTDGSWWEMPNSYFLVDLAAGNTNSISLGEVPKGSYSGISYMLGVDSLHNVSGTQTGALDPAHDMFWGWTSGYVMLKVEGFTPDIAPETFFSLHCAGYSGAYNVVQTISHSFPTPVEVGLQTKTIKLHCNPSHVWLTSGIQTYNNIAGMGHPAQRVTSDFYSSFIFDGVN